MDYLVIEDQLDNLESVVYKELVERSCKVLQVHLDVMEKMERRVIRYVITI